MGSGEVAGEQRTSLAWRLGPRRLKIQNKIEFHAERNNVSPSSSQTRLKRAFNFSGGPATLPLPILERVREELLDYRGTGMSVMEMSHRSPEFEEINSRAEQMLRKLIEVPDDYAVIFLQGGGSMQFAMVPMNLYLPGKPIDMLHTGMWTAKAITELRKGTPYRIAASSENDKFRRIPREDEIHL